MGSLSVRAVAVLVLAAGTLGAAQPRPSEDAAGGGLRGGPRGGTEVVPYLSLGWGDPPEPASVLRETGVDGFSFAFVLSAGRCVPRWDGTRPLEGGVDARAVRAVRAAGGEPVVSFGGGGGRTLERYCPHARALASAYERVIRTYGLRAIDIDIETAAYKSATARTRTVEALKRVRAAHPGLSISVTLPSLRGGPDDLLIREAARAGLAPDTWTIMPFAFGERPQQQAAREDMARSTLRAAEGLKARLRRAYGYGEAEAYAHSGISTMNGITGHQEVITPADFRVISRYARGHGLGRLAFWSVNRDRPCGTRPYPAEDRCSGVRQRPWEFTRALSGGLSG